MPPFFRCELLISGRVYIHPSISENMVIVRVEGSRKENWKIHFQKQFCLPIKKTGGEFLRLQISSHTIYSDEVLVFGCSRSGLSFCKACCYVFDCRKISRGKGDIPRFFWGKSNQQGTSPVTLYPHDMTR